MINYLSEIKYEYKLLKREFNSVFLHSDKTCSSDAESVMECPAGRNEMQHHLSSGCPGSVRADNRVKQ